MQCMIYHDDTNWCIDFDSITSATHGFWTTEWQRLNENSEQLNPDEHWPVDTFLFSWNWSTIWYQWYVSSIETNKFWLPPLVDWVLHQISFPAIDPDCINRRCLNRRNRVQVLLWAGSLITFIDSTNNIVAKPTWKPWAILDGQVTYLFLSGIVWENHNHKSITSYPYIPFKICQASHFPSLSVSKDPLPNWSKPLHPNHLPINHQHVWTKHET